MEVNASLNIFAASPKFGLLALVLILFFRSLVIRLLSNMLVLPQQPADLIMTRNAVNRIGSRPPLLSPCDLFLPAHSREGDSFPENPNFPGAHLWTPS